MRALLFILLAALTAAPAAAQYLDVMPPVARSTASGGGGGGGDVFGPASATNNACVRWDTTTGKLVKDSGCSIADTGVLTSAGFVSTSATDDLTGGTNGDVFVTSLGTGTLNLETGTGNTTFFRRGDGTVITALTLSGSSARFSLSSFGGGAAFGAGVSGLVGVTTAAAVNSVAGCFGSSITSAGGTNLVCGYGGGKLAIAVQQAATCAAGVLALDPTSSVVYLNAGGAACAVTLGETNAQVGTDVLIVLTANVAGAVTFPNVTNVHAGPTACTTTGLSTIGSTYRVHYASTIAQYVGVSCSSN